MTGIILQAEDGSREFINVDVDTNNLDAVTKSWVLRGLQSLLLEGRSVVLNLKSCGASGRASYVEAVR